MCSSNENQECQQYAELSERVKVLEQRWERIKMYCMILAAILVLTTFFIVELLW